MYLLKGGNEGVKNATNDATKMILLGKLMKRTGNEQETKAVVSYCFRFLFVYTVDIETLGRKNRGNEEIANSSI